MVGLMMKKQFKIFIFLVMAIAISACSIEASISNITDFSSTTLDKMNGAEFVSGSNQYDQTLLRNYKVNSSAGSITKEIRSETPRGYKMYSSVQGALISSQEGL
jgi:hypothetical protein